MFGAELFVLMVLISLAGAVIAVLLRDQEKSCRIASFGTAAISSAMALTIALQVLLDGQTITVTVPTTVAALGNFSFVIDRLSAFFVLTISILSLAVSIYSVGYTAEYSGRYSIGLMGALFNLFLLSMLLVVSAANAILFLIVWETMSLLSYLLVIYEHRKKEGVSAGLLYIVMTHLGTALITAAFVLMWTYTGSFDFGSFRGASGIMPDLAKSSVFLLLLFGFGTKAGLVPMHVWLPQAHPAAPSNISALMSGVMVKTAIYMLIRCYFDFLGVTDAWWGLLVLAIACVSALVGVLYAVMETDIKRSLAFSTVENVGLIFIALGAAMIFQAYYQADPVANVQLASLAALALIAALFHVLSHSLFKGLLFMGAGAVLHATHTKNMEELGGLAKKMRWTGVLFFIGVLSISAIPPFSGFVGEWLMLQSLLLSLNVNDVMVNLLIPIAVAVLALTGALAAACFVRMFGVTFLARPRTPHAEDAKEVPRSMLIGMGIAAVLCVLMGVLSFLIIPQIDTVTSSVLGVSIASKLVNGLVLSPPAGSFSSMSPLVLAALFLAIIPCLYLLNGGRRGAARTEQGDTWDCGTPLTSRNEYTATGYSQPINRLFKVVYRPRVQTSVEYTSSPLIKKRILYRSSIDPIFERYIYGPITKAAVTLARRISVIQTGSIQAYLAYIFVVLLVLLVVFR